MRLFCQPIFFKKMAESIGLTSPYDQVTASNLVSAERIYFEAIRNQSVTGGSVTNPVVVKTLNIGAFSSGILLITLFSPDGDTSGPNTSGFSNPTPIIPNMPRFEVLYNIGTSFRSTSKTGIQMTFTTTTNSFIVSAYSPQPYYLMWCEFYIMILA